MKRVSSPIATTREILPIAMSSSEGDRPRIATGALKRISGNKMISPDNDDKNTIQRSGIGRVIGSFKVCFDATGAVTQVTVLQSTGSLNYDQKILAGTHHGATGRYRARPSGRCVHRRDRHLLAALVPVGLPRV